MAPKKTVKRATKRTAKGACAGVSAREEKKWRIETDLRTLQTAQEISRDPKRMAAVKKLAADNIKVVQKVAVKR